MRRLRRVRLAGRLGLPRAVVIGPVVVVPFALGALDPDRGAEVTLSAHVDVLHGIQMPLAVVVVMAAAGSVVMVVISHPDDPVPRPRILFHDYNRPRAAHADFPDVAANGCERQEETHHGGFHRFLLAGQISCKSLNRNRHAAPFVRWQQCEHDPSETLPLEGRSYPDVSDPSQMVN
jgi:hypothetical protein